MWTRCTTNLTIFRHNYVITRCRDQTQQVPGFPLPSRQPTFGCVSIWFRGGDPWHETHETRLMEQYQHHTNERIKTFRKLGTVYLCISANSTDIIPFSNPKNFLTVHSPLLIHNATDRIWETEGVLNRVIIIKYLLKGNFKLLVTGL